MDLEKLGAPGNQPRPPEQRGEQTQAQNRTDDRDLEDTNLGLAQGFDQNGDHRETDRGGDHKSRTR